MSQAEELEDAITEVEYLTELILRLKPFWTNTPLDKECSEVVEGVLYDSEAYSIPKGHRTH